MERTVFIGDEIGPLAIGDPSAPPATTNLLSRVIEYTGNVIIGSGGLDMLVPTNGTLLVLQNVTWGGVQGFQERPGKPVSQHPRCSNWNHNSSTVTVLLALPNRLNSGRCFDGRRHRHLGT